MKQVRRNRTGRRGGGTGILALALALWLIAPSAARADCTVQANGTTILVPQTRAAGTIIYNADHHVYQGCQGDKWVLLPVSGGGYDGTCTQVGEVCSSDGTVYIGDSPLDGAPLYTTRCDLGRTWNGQSCEGDPDKNCWDDCSGSAIATNITRTSDAYDGHFNTAALSVFDMGSGGGVQTSVAMNACRSLNIDGHTDWYVPSLNEMMLMRTAHTQIGDFDRTGYPTAFYHVASEEDNAFATLMSFYDGETLASTLKQYDSYMLTRCIRKGAANAEAAPTGCAAAGNSCSDGTKYAGDHPLMAGVKLYVTTADQSAGATWSGVSANTGADSSYNGYSNQAWLMHNATAGDYPAAQLCDNLTANGHSDWYLPSRYELNVLYTNRVAIGGFGTDNYWSSTESTTSNARRQSFSTGTSGSVAKSTSYRVRCVRIDNFD